MKHPINDIHYKEGVFVGYRWYESRKIAPLYAFGHGLSYTTFAYEGLAVSPARLTEGGEVELRFKIKNTGAVAGAAVAQVYVGPVSPSVPRPGKELKAFSKVALAPGETRALTIRLPRQAFAFWDTATHAWKVQPGSYRILIGGASDQTALEGKVTLP
jgi:beta-glucosidase